MKYEQISLEFSNYIWYLLTNSEYKSPPKEIYNELIKRLTWKHYNFDKFYSCQYIRNVLIQLEDDLNISRNVCLSIKSRQDKFNDEFYAIIIRINELMNNFNSNNISSLIFMHEMNKVVQRLNNLLANSYV